MRRHLESIYVTILVAAVLTLAGFVTASYITIRLAQPPPPASAPEPAPTDSIDQELVICEMYRQNITPLPGRIEYDSISADVVDLSKAGHNALDVFTYAITQAAETLKIEQPGALELVYSARPAAGEVSR